MKRWPVAAVVVTLVLSFLVVLLGVLGVVALTTIGRLNAEVNDLATQLADAEVRIAELEAELENAQGAEGASIIEDLLGGLLG
jgi:CHASE3 domain sensor protein